MIVMIKMVKKNFFFLNKFIRICLAYRQQLREKSQPSHPWHRVTGQRQNNIQIHTPQTVGIHISEAATV